MDLREAIRLERERRANERAERKRLWKKNMIRGQGHQGEREDGTNGKADNCRQLRTEPEVDANSREAHSGTAAISDRESGS